MFMVSFWLPKMVMAPKVAGILRQICQVQGSFKCIQEAPSKDSVMWVLHVNDIEGDVFCEGIFLGAIGYWEYDDSDQFDSFPGETIEGLRRFSELFLIETHLVEGC
jgi:hypothetical protein